VSLAIPRRSRGVASDPQAAWSHGRAQRTASGYTPDSLAPRLRLLRLPLPLPTVLAARLRTKIMRLQFRAWEYRVHAMLLRVM
jgi:hypothetical protein